jgi:addiction module RelE/StbE family toxin
MRIKFSKSFVKKYKKLPKKVKLAFDQRLFLFVKDQNNLLLVNHNLKGKFKEYRSINITGDYRVLYRKFKREDIIVFDAIGTHSELYK